ncbi:MAG: gas vesicle protein [Ilumatobacter sp.]|nr:gas vesicle protein [Ilumatobacter sp.]
MPMATPEGLSTARRRTTLVDALDASLQRGVAIRGEIMLSIADVDLVTIDLRALLASVDAVSNRKVVRDAIVD